jgi:EAL domain-containing protein (putative c-di-GMP-specific phosphodiesterase class I)/GGDEF domain-containing protein
MSLKRQLFILMFVVFSTLMAAVLTIQFNTTVRFLKAQQSTELNNAITSVSMALSPYLEKGDMVSAQTVIRATFDNSVYQSVSLKNLKNGHVFTQSYTSETPSIPPSWFVSLMNIQPIKRQTIVTSGWLQLAQLNVISSPATMYSHLWKSTWHTFIYFSVFFLIALIVALIWLNQAFKSLKLIECYAEQIANNKFDARLPKSNAREFDSVLDSLKEMAEQLKQHFTQQVKEAEKLRIRAYQDPLSGLANRRYTLTQLSSWITRSNHGGLILLKVSDIYESYRQNDYLTADEEVHLLSQRLQRLSETDTVIGRLNKAEFLLIVSHVNAEELKALAESILHITNNRQNTPFATNTSQAYLGLVMNHDVKDTQDALTQLDNAVMTAKNNPQDPIVFYKKTNNGKALGKQAWKHLIQSAIANKNFHFRQQKAIDINNKIIHEEVFSYIQQDQTRYYAHQFLFMVEKLDIGAQLDMHIIEKAIEDLQQHKFKTPIAINLTQSAINNIGFIRWLSGKTKGLPELQDRLIFELPESSFIKAFDNTALLCDALTQHSFNFGIDHFGRNFSTIDYLTLFHPAYVKLDFAYTQNISDETQLDSLHSIIQIAHNLHIQTIATRVETSEQQKILAEQAIDGFQGYVVDTLHTENQA